MTRSRISQSNIANKIDLFGRRNLVINGAMQIAQRATSKTGITAPNYYTVDRMQTELQSAGTWTMSQSDDVPTGLGFTKSIKYNCTTANASLSTSSYFIQRHSFEGQDLQRLMYGTSDAKPVTISFYVKSNKTGTYVCELQQLPGDGTYPRTGKSFTIDSANTWERKIITLNGNTAKTLPDSNARGLDIMIWMAGGTDFTSGTFNAGNSWDAGNTQRASALSVNIADSTSNEIYFTGLQMEIGTSATDFEHRLFAEELLLCQRYYSDQFPPCGAGVTNGTTGVARINIPLAVQMRTAPTISQSGNINVYSGIQASYFSSFNQSWATPDKVEIDATTAGTIQSSGGKGLAIYNETASSGTINVAKSESAGGLKFDAEL